MSTTVIIVLSVVIFALLVALGIETVREFKRMDRDPEDFTGSDRLAGSAE